MPLLSLNPLCIPIIMYRCLAYPVHPPLTLVTRGPMYGKQARDSTLCYRRARALIATYALFFIVYRIVGQRPGYASQPPILQDAHQHMLGYIMRH